MKKNKINWDAVYRGLEQWRNGLNDERNASSGKKEPSVSTVAEQYRHDPWAVLVSTVLSHRTKDAVTLDASQRLLAKAPSPQKLAVLSLTRIAELIYPVGFYRDKADSLKKIAGILIQEHGGKVPSTMDELLALPKVGRKTANLVLIEAFDLPGICVDVHVHRISNRAGWLLSKTPDKTEMILREILPEKYWKGLNALLVLYGQNVCRPVSPFCSRCVIKKHCARCAVEFSR